MRSGARTRHAPPPAGPAPAAAAALMILVAAAAGPGPARAQDRPAAVPVAERFDPATGSRVRATLADLGPGQLRAVQAALGRAGFDPGVRTGRMDAATRSALAAFQRARGLDACGCPSYATVRALGLGTRVAETVLGGPGAAFAHATTGPAAAVGGGDGRAPDGGGASVRREAGVVVYRGSGSETPAGATETGSGAGTAGGRGDGGPGTPGGGGAPPAGTVRMDTAYGVLLLPGVYAPGRRGGAWPGRPTPGHGGKAGPSGPPAGGAPNPYAPPLPMLPPPREGSGGPGRGGDGAG